MTPELRIVVHGTPEPKGSKNRGRNGAMYESAKGLPAWSKSVTKAAEAAIADGGATFPGGGIVLGVAFRFDRPDFHYRSGRFSNLLGSRSTRTHVVKPDVDKLARALLDALTKAGAWHDDAQVCAMWATKEYVTRGDGRQPGATIIVRAASVLDEVTVRPALQVVPSDDTTQEA